MYLSKSIEVLKSAVSNNLYSQSSDLIQKYLLTRFENERRLKNFNSDQKFEKAMAQDLIFGVSPKRINSAIKNYKSFNSEINVKEDSVDNIYDFIIADLTPRFKEPYIEYVENIKKYIDLMLQLKKESSVFKSKQSEIIKELRDEIKENGMIISLLNDLYITIKVSINMNAEIGDLTTEKEFLNTLELIATKTYHEEIEIRKNVPIYKLKEIKLREPLQIKKTEPEENLEENLEEQIKRWNKIDEENKQALNERDLNEEQIIQDKLKHQKMLNEFNANPNNFKQYGVA